MTAMNDQDVARCWEANAEAWTALSRAGYDESRDIFNTPQFLAILPEIRGLAGLDMGCGEGHNTRLLAARGAQMTGIDIAAKFLDYAHESERASPLGIAYRLANAQHLPFGDASFDFVTAFMSLMDMPEPEQVVREAYRVIRPGGFFQFSICHPCFQTWRWQWVRDPDGKKTGIVCGDYFERRDGAIEEWIFGAAPEELKRHYPKFRIPRFFRTFSEWTSMLLAAGFTLSRFQEPAPDAQTVRAQPRFSGDRLFAWFLHVQGRKEGT
jgi:2-polyprenyl-3-methyl-5-hydroxy-6-metoxy-1,4-benzoquinol methylase